MAPFFYPYASLADASQYWQLHLGGNAWHIDATEPLCKSVKLAALYTASELLDTLDWAGCKTDPSQESAFPRSGMVDTDNFHVDPNVIPEVLKRATIKLALLIATDQVQPNSNALQPPVKKAKAGDVEVEYFAHELYTLDNGVCGKAALQDAFTTVMPMLRPYLRSSRSRPQSLAVCRG